ncbi:hypothetical protein BTR22_06385 [Alkalihalophilus pseudofirmus]|nr:hypothetical protein BTR22_06385 [Alkalihalophilus pseudofirmus]
MEGIKVKNDKELRLTSSELMNLWTQYLNDSAASQVLRYYLKHVEDEEVKNVLTKALKSTTSHVEFIEKLYKKEGIAKPIGFSENDIVMGAPRLFSDTFYIYYLLHLSTLGMAAGGVVISTSSRTDIVEFFRKVTQDAEDLHCLIKEVTKAKGIHNRPPYIPYPKEAVMVEDQDYLGSMFGKQRPINTIELTHIFTNIQTNTIGKTLMIGFSQVCHSDKLRSYILRGKDIANKQVAIFRKLLETNDIPVPSPWDSAVTESTVAPFSDKLMLFHITAMSAAGIGNYGAAMAASPRKDIGLKYARLLMEISLYAEDGANLMIENGWLEQPPQVPDRNELASKSKGYE